MYVITGKGRIFKGGRHIPLSDYEKEFTEAQIATLIKTKFLKIIRSKKDDKSTENTNTD